LKKSRFIWQVVLAASTALAFSPADAHAGPLVAAIGAAFTAIQSIPVLGALASAVVSMGANMLLSKLLAPKEPDPVGIKQKLSSGGDNPISFIMGEYATPGKLVYVNQVDDGDLPNNKLVLVISLSELPVSGFSDILWINGDKATVDDSFASPVDPADDGTTFASYSPRPGYFRIVEYDKRGGDKYNTQYCWMRFYDGTQTAADPWLKATFGSDPDKPWTDDMIGKGCAYVVVVCVYSDEGIWSGVPEFKFVVRGIPLYDPRKDSSVGGSGSQRWNNPATWGYSENPVVMKYNILRGISYNGEWVWGGQGVEAQHLPLSYWFAAMNHCDETVSLASGGSVKRYYAGAEISVDTQPMDAIKELDKACAGYTTEYGGLWKTWSGPPGASVFSFTDEDIIITEDQTDNLFRPLQETYNGARATYTRPDAGWVSKDAAPIDFDGSGGSDDLVSEDGYRLIASVQLPMVTLGNQAQRLMRAAVKDSRRQITHVLQLPPEAYILEPFDVVTWTSDRNGYVNKKFRVESIDDLPNCNQLVMIRETDPTDYDWDTSFELPESVGTLTPVRPGTLGLDFTVTADQVDNDTGGKDKPAINIAWTWGGFDNGVKSIRWEVRKHGTTKVIASGKSHNVDEGSRTITSAAFRFGKQYDVRLMAVPSQRGRDTNWTAWKSVTLFNIDIPTAPTLTRISDLADDGTLNFFLDIDWTAVAGTVTYVVRVAITGGSTRTYRTQDNNYRIPVTSGKTYTVDVRAVAEGDGGSVGSFSPTASTTVTKKNTAPTAPTSLTATGENHRVILKVNKSPDADFKRAIFYGSDTNDFTTAAEVDRNGGVHGVDDHLANNKTRYYWVTFEDRSGNESSKYPASNTAGVSATTVRLVDDDGDITPLSAPTGLTLTQDNADLNGDGTVDIAILTSWTDLGSAAKQYEVELSQSATSGGTYTVIDNKTTKQNAIRFPAKTTKWYKARIRALNAFGNPGTWSGLTTAFQPSKKSATPGAPSGFSITPKPKGLRANWTQAADTDIKRYELYVNTTNSSSSGGTLVKAGNGDDFLYAAELTVGQNYYCFLRSVDRSDNVSAWISASNNPQVYRRVTASDMAILDMHANAENTDLSLGPNIGWTDPATIINDPTNAFQGNYVIKRAYTGLASSWVNRNNMVFPVRAGEQYYFGGMVKKDGSFASTNMGWRLSWRDDTNTEIGDTALAATTSITTSWQEIGALATVPAGAAYACLEFAIYNQTAGTGFGSHGYARPAVTDGMTDQTALAAPSGLTISQDNIDVDGDGKVDIALLLTWTDLGATAKYYEIELSQATSSGGSYTVIDNKTTKQNKKRFPAKTTYWYKARIRAFNFAGVPGTWSSLTSAFQPSKKSALPTAPTGFSITPKPKGLRGAWTQPADADIRRYEWYVNTTNSSSLGGTIVKAGNGDDFLYGADLTIGQAYYCFIRSVDRSGNASAWVAASNNPQTYRTGSAVASDNDFDTTALSAPTISSHAQNNTDLNGDGTVDMAISLAWGAVTNATSYEVEISRSTTSGGTYTVIGAGGVTNNLTWSYPCNVNYFYKARVRARNAYGQPGTWSSLTSALQPAGRSTAPADPTSGGIASGPLAVFPFMHTPVDLDYWYTEVLFNSGSTPAPTDVTPYVCTLTNTNSSARGFIYVGDVRALSTAWARHVNRSGQKSNWVSLGLVVIPGIDTGQLVDGSVTYAKMSDAPFLVKNASATLSVGDLGTIATCKNTTGSLIGNGSTTAGSNLVYSDNGGSTGSSPSGTWQCMGRAPAGQVTTFLRVA
jgi:hypothetical protein